MENEIWKEYPANTGYLVSSLGRVKTKTRISNRGRILKGLTLKQQINSHGYLAVKIVRSKRVVHQLVAETFLGHKPCGFKLVVNHIDFNKKNNRVDNLEIVTTRENTNKKHLKSSSRYTGVDYQKTAKKWRARILIDKKSKALGYFKCELAAAHAYQIALKQLYVNGV